MRAWWRAFRAVVRLDAMDVLRSRWLVLCGAVYGVLLMTFVLVGLRESSIFGFTGTGRVLVSVTHALLVVLPLLALTATGLTVNRSRDDGTLELLLSCPVPRGAWFSAVTVVRTAVLVGPFAIVLVGGAAYGRLAHGQEIPWGFLGRCVLVGAVLLWSFVGLGLLVSTLVRGASKALMYVLLLWMSGVALLDFALIGVMLQWQLPPRVVFVLAAVNPVQAARLALLSSAEPELTTLGPVGFWMANQLGPGPLLAVGLAWPLALGTAAWLLALDAFRRRDVA